MLFLLITILFSVAYCVLNCKLIRRRPRKWTGAALIAVGSISTYSLDSHMEEMFIWGFVAAWCIGLELYFNCDKYKGYY